MRKILCTGILAVTIVTAMLQKVMAQSMHFSQYYNAPMLLSPANTGLMAESDYRIGVNYRNQWSTIPVPFNTTSAYGDFQAFHNENNNNCLGIGFAFFNDKAGDGNLSLTSFQTSVAYHLQTGTNSMLSVGLSGGFVQRSVNYDNLTFDMQWDGFTFSPALGNGESGGIRKTSFLTVGAGVNYAYFPNDNVYIKVGVGVANLNQPNETFYSGTNALGMRPTANVDALLSLSKSVILNPSVYYATQKGASELLYGTLFRINASKDVDNVTQIILGAYDRWNDAFIGVAGVEWKNIQVLGSYDFTMSSLAPYTSGNGALEFSVVFKGLYSYNKGRRMYNCPRFF